MNTLILFRILVLASLIVVTPGYAVANVAGKTGSFAAGCGTCHGFAAAATTVTLEGLRTVRANQSVSYTFVVANANLANQNAGCNVSFRSGANVIGTITAGAGSKVEDGELTHNGAALAMVANSARFAFTWVAPAAHGVYAFSGAGNAVNLDGISNNQDQWNVTGNINITVSGATFTAPAVGTAICRGNALTFTWTQTGHTTVRLEWSRDNFVNTEVIGTSVDATALTFTYNVPGTQVPGDYILRMVDPTSGVEIARTNSITIAGSPVITLQPVATTVCEGKVLSLSVSASGTGLEYRWRRNGVDIPGGVNPILVINTVGVAEAGQYACVIYGCGGSSTSNVVTVTIGMRPRITTQPNAATVCEGDSVTFRIEATGTGINLQWLKNGEPIPGKIANTIKFFSVTLFDEGDYVCLVQGLCTPEAMSVVAKLNVIEKPLVRSEPNDRNLKSGDTLTLTFDASGEQLSYQWHKDGVAIDGGTVRIYRKSNVVRSDSGVYTCRVSNQCETVSTRGAVVRITSSSGPGKLELTSTSLLIPSLASCGTHDTLMKGLLVNEGGLAITITSFSAEPIALIAIEGIVAPLSLAPNERRDVRFKITPRQPGPFTATATFYASSGNRTFTITGQAQTGLAFARDTLFFTPGVIGDRRCNVSLPFPCLASTITRIRITGTGASTWTSHAPQTPLTVDGSNTIDVCFETNTETGEDALVTLDTDAGSTSFILSRRLTSSVDEDEGIATSIRCVPNPMTDELRITSPFPGELRARIVTVTGITVALLTGYGEIVWNRRDSNGSTVPSGLYVVFLEQSGTTIYRKVIVR